MMSNTMRYILTGRRAGTPELGRPWKVWDLDAELRYAPVVEALPALDLPICEVGSGPAGLARWIDRPVWGVDPGADERHVGVPSPPNLTRVQSDGASIPLPDRSASATVAVDTFEHIPPAARQAVVDEMKRVTAPGGRVIIIGPTGPDAAAGDRRVLDRWTARDDGGNIEQWLGEHFENGLPTVQELTGLLGTDRVARVTATGVFPVRHWWTMHRATLGDFPQPRGFHLIHHLTWGPFGAVARRDRRGPFYRWLVVADLAADA
jgi:SAM-dependent methyltransferase